MLAVPADAMYHFQIIVALILLELSFLSYGDPTYPEICESKECYDAAEHIKKWMNPAFKPCDDFYEFSCGYWHSPENKTENKKHNSSMKSGDDIYNAYLKKILRDDTGVKESNLFQLLKTFMTLCLDEDTINSRGVDPAVQFLREAGGWPLLEKDWSEANWNIFKAEILLDGVFLSIYPETKESGIVSLQIKPKIDFDDSMEGFLELHKEFMKMIDIAIAFGAERTEVEEEMRKIMIFEMDLSILADGLKKKNEYQWYNLSQLQNEIPWVNWSYLLAETLPKSITLRPNDTFFVASPDKFTEFGTLINRYPKRVVANYMMTKTALRLSKYLPLNVNNITGDMKSDRFENCVDIVKENSLAGVILESYVARRTADDARVAKDIARNIKEEFILHLKDLNWIDEKTRSVGIETLKNTKLQISFPEEMFDLKTVESLFKTVKVNTSHFFEAVMDMWKWDREDRFTNVGKVEEDISLRDKTRLAMTEMAFFFTRRKMIAVTAGFLHLLPLFSAKLPLYINYGHLGTIIAHEMIHALDFQVDDYNPYSKKVLIESFKLWGSNETEETYNEKKQCVIDQYSSFNDTKYTNKTINGTLTERENVADNGGFKLALNAYRRMAAKLPSPEPKLPGLQEYSNEQLFLISLANVFCEIPEKDKLIDQLKDDPHSPFEFRIKGMMINSPDFSKLFSCKKGDPMNPVHKCEVWNVN